MGLFNPTPREVRDVQCCRGCDLMQWQGQASDMPVCVGTPAGEPWREIMSRELDDYENPPEWCPLRDGPVLIQLKPRTA